MMDKDSALFLEQAGDELKKCVKCGACQGVCPIYLETKQEKYVARGKIALSQAVSEGRLPYTNEFNSVLHNCLLCLSCVEVCSSNVRVDRIITAARSSLVRERGLPWPKRMAFKALRAGRWTQNLLFQGGSLAQTVLFHRLPKSSGLRRRFPVPGVDKEQVVPRLAPKSFRSRHEEYIPAGEDTNPVVFFTGCSANYIFPLIAEAALWVLNRLGRSVYIAADQMCCGAPAECHGDQETVHELARKNLFALSGRFDQAPVIVICSSGGYMFKHVYPELFSTGQEARLASELAARTYDISEYLVHKVGLEEIGEKITTPCTMPTTYHDPCHLKRGQGIEQEPRRLLHLACPEHIVPLPEADRCCGSGGTYGLSHKDMSRAILGHKTEAIQASGAAQIATGCPACMIQLQDGISRAGLQGEVKHTIEVVAEALGWKMPREEKG
ncbi:MAG: (Fe-S)-binding protein [Desulfovermiculus sp.]